MIRTGSTTRISFWERNHRRNIYRKTHPANIKFNKETYICSIRWSNSRLRPRQPGLVISIYKKTDSPKDTITTYYFNFSNNYMQTRWLLSMEILRKYSKLTWESAKEDQNPHFFYNLYMDYVMRVFLLQCEAEQVQFMKQNYAIPPSATKNGENNLLGSYGTRYISAWLDRLCRRSRLSLSRYA